MSIKKMESTLEKALISHMADDKVSFQSLISLTSKTQESVALMTQDMSYIKEDIREIKDIMNVRYVSRDEFDPIKKIVYGVVGILLSAVIIALAAVVIK